MEIALNNLANSQMTNMTDNRILSDIDKMDLTNVDETSGVDFATQVLNNSTMFDQLVAKASGLVDNISTTHALLSDTLKNGHINSQAEALMMQDKLEEFTLSTQLFSKVVSTSVKNIDTLVRIQ